MRPRRSQQRIQALTLIEVVVILSVITVVAVLLIPSLTASKLEGDLIQCNNNLKQVGLANRVWAEDHYHQYPLITTTNNNGSNELLWKKVPDAQLALWNFTVMSNELSSPRVLHCPADRHTTVTRDFANLGNGNISYFASLDATETYPQMILSGDASLAVNGTPVKSGVLELSSNTPVAWTAERHDRKGNICIADGSVQCCNLQGLQTAVQYVFATVTNSTNRFAIP